MKAQLIASAAFVVSAAFAAACSTDPTNGQALGSIAVMAGDAQTGTPGFPLPDTLQAQVLDNTGHPMAGVPVTWSVTSGGGTLGFRTDTSDALGGVRAVVILGGVPGTAHIVATVADFPGARFTEMGRGFRAIQISLGFEHTCAIDAQARGWCWGASVARGDSGIGGPEKNFVPQRVSGGHLFAEMAAGSSHTCGLDTDGHTWCWGENFAGQLGSGASGPSTFPLPLANAPVFTRIISGDADFTCGLTADSAAYCWGDNGKGQIGGGSNAASIPDPMMVSGGHKFVVLTTGGSRACGIAADSTAWCWGQNVSGGALGFLGDSGLSGTASNVPVAVYGGHLFTTLVATDRYACGLTTDAGPVCWGTVPDGQSSHLVPVPESALVPLNEFGPGESFSGGVEGGQALTVWNFNTIENANAPLLLHGLSASTWASCALAQDGTIYCWGQNTGGELGNPDQFGYDDGYSTAHAVVAPPGS